MKHFMLVIGLILGGAALSAGCGDSGGGGGFMGVCMDNCMKSNECNGTSTDCESQCEAASALANACSNTGELKSHTQMCNGIDDCDEFNMCQMEGPACEE